MSDCPQCKQGDGYTLACAKHEPPAPYNHTGAMASLAMSDIHTLRWAKVRLDLTAIQQGDK